MRSPSLVALSRLHLPPARQVYFEHEAGFRIVNLVSYNDKGELLLTYSFANGIPMVEPGEELSAEDLNARVGAGVEGSIRRIRELVVDGAIV